MENSAAFQIMRFQILTAALSKDIGPKLPDAYVFAWDKGVFPVMHHGNLHEPFGDCFRVGQALADQVVRLFCDSKPSLNDLEGYVVQFGDFKKGIALREKLIDTCRYIYLSEYYESECEYIMESSPDEASRIVKPYSIKDISFV